MFSIETDERMREYEVGIDLNIPIDTPSDIIQTLLDDISEAAQRAFAASNIAKEWNIELLGRFGEKV